MKVTITGRVHSVNREMLFTSDEGIATYPIPKKWGLIARDRVLTIKGEWITREERDGI